VPKLVAPALSPGSLARLSQPIFEVDELVLRPWSPGDAPAVVAAYREPSIQQWHVRSMTGREARTWVSSWTGRWAKETGAGWALTIDDALVGQISLGHMNFSDGATEVSYWVLPAARGNSVAPRALHAVTSWALERLRLHRVRLTHSSANAASCRVAAKAGFVLEGTMRGEALHADGWHDMRLHARLSGDAR